MNKKGYLNLIMIGLLVTATFLYIWKLPKMQKDAVVEYYGEVKNKGLDNDNNYETFAYSILEEAIIIHKFQYKILMLSSVTFHYKWIRRGAEPPRLYVYDYKAEDYVLLDSNLESTYVSEEDTEVKPFDLGVGIGKPLKFKFDMGYHGRLYDTELRW